MTMLKRTGLRITSLLLTALIFLSCFTAVSYAAKDNVAAQIRISVLDKNKKEDVNPARGDTITVVVKIENYKTMPASISAMHITASFDPSFFEYVPESGNDDKKSHVLCKVRDADLTSYNFDGTSKVSFAYTYANNAKQSLDKSRNDIFSFKLKVKGSVNNKTRTDITVTDYTLFKTDADGAYQKVECNKPEAAKLTLWARKPEFLINDSAEIKNVYNEDVTLKINTGTGTYSFEGRDPEDIIGEKVFTRNGNYVITVNGTVKVFTINKTITSIMVKDGTYMREYPIGSEPDYYNWLLSVTYTDGSPSEIPMDDDEITITGFVPNTPGDHRLTIGYKGQTTHVNVRVSSKKVTSIYARTLKNEYLKGDEIDLSSIELSVAYDDGSTSEIPVTASMLDPSTTEYMELGPNTVTVTYPGVSEPSSFSIEVLSREPVDELIAAIDAIDLDAISEDSREQLTELNSKYDALKDAQKAGVTNKSRLDRAIDTLKEIILGQVTDVTTEAETTSEETTVQEESTPKGRVNIIWFIVAGVIILAVVGGIIYFLVIYFKRKKEMDEDEYYDDGDFDDDAEDDGDLSYEEDIIDADEEDEDDDGPASVIDNAVTERVSDPKSIFEKEKIKQEEEGPKEKLGPDKTVGFAAAVAEKEAAEEKFEPDKTVGFFTAFEAQEAVKNGGDAAAGNEAKTPARGSDEVISDDDNWSAGPEPSDDKDGDDDDDDDFIGKIVILDDDETGDNK